MRRHLIAMLAFIPFPAFAGDVVVSLGGLPSADGVVEVSLCTEETWLSENCVSQTVRADAEPLSTTFTDVAPGVYGVVAVHDENENGEMDMRWYGAPKEFYGASNNPEKRRGPDRFEDAKFEVAEAPLALEIILRGWGKGRR